MINCMDLLCLRLVLHLNEDNIIACAGFDPLVEIFMFYVAALNINCILTIYGTSKHKHFKQIANVANVYFVLNTLM